MAKPWKAPEKKTDRMRLYAFPQIRALYLTAFVTRKGSLCLHSNIMETLKIGFHHFR